MISQRNEAEGARGLWDTSREQVHLVASVDKRRRLELKLSDKRIDQRAVID